MFALLAFALAAAPHWSKLTASYSYDDYMRDFPRSFARGSEEHAMRKALFEKKLAAVLKHNAAGTSTFRKGINHLSDRTAAELARMRGRKIMPEWLKAKAPVWKPSGKALPDRIDWREKGAVTPVKDQGECGSCWAFAATSTLESLVAVNNGSLFLLSPQAVLECVENPNQCGGTGGCDGAVEALAYQWVSEHGLTDEWRYSYSSYDGNSKPGCKQGAEGSLRAPVITVDGWLRVENNKEEALLAAIAEVGPISVGVDATLWDDYAEGIFDLCGPLPDYGVAVNHAVHLVGYTPDAWIIRNSWSPLWGDNGYIHLPRADRGCYVDLAPLDGSGCKDAPANVTVCGACGLYYETSFPTGARIY